MMMDSLPRRQTRVERYRTARCDQKLAVLEGVHALKHAVRFGADVFDAATPDLAALLGLSARLAPDLPARLSGLADEVAADEFALLAPKPPATGVIAIAHRPVAPVRGMLDDRSTAPAVLLDRPIHLGNIGAVVRVAAASGARGVLTTGSKDPWHPRAIRGAAGLHFALPVSRMEALPACDAPIIAIHPEGDPLVVNTIPRSAILAFGSERSGLGAALLERAEMQLRIPMAAGVSSLNLATSVAAVLYAWRLSQS
jgi:tRNA G18 (ribose-2'-O)-methylase SpoU